MPLPDEEPETIEDLCPHCERTTTWLVITVDETQRRFECTNCCKISREVHLGAPGRGGHMNDNKEQDK